jgi:CelD/BcsL family acetyltransferase involved in cellulose biosynthesis
MASEMSLPASSDRSLGPSPTSPPSQPGLNPAGLAEPTCQVATSFAELTLSRQDWDDAVVRLGGTIYLTYDWVRTWWDFYGDGHELRLLIFRCGNRLVGLIPLYLTRLGVWPFNFRVARLVGANIPPKVFNPPIEEPWVGPVLRRVVAQIVGTERCHLLSLGPISELYGRHILSVISHATGLNAQVTLRPCGVHSVFILPTDYEEYFRSLTKKERKNNKNRYDLSLLREERAADEEILSDPVRVIAEFEPFVRLHTGEWERKGGTGHFFSWPKGFEFNRAVLTAQAELGRVEFVRIGVDGKTIASIYGYHLGKVFFAELLGRELRPEWEKYNLGRTILVRAVAQAIHRGCQVVDAGLGHYDYKERLNAQEQKVFQVRFRPARLGGRWALWVLDAVRAVLALFYHKIWYRRIRKHLPLQFRKPQANLWLRYDF